MITIREASTNDVAYIALLGRITYTESHGKYIKHKQDLLAYYNTYFTIENISKEIEDINNFFWIVLVDNLPVGYAKLSLNESHENATTKAICRLQKIYILNDFIGMKLGQHLLDQVLTKATKLRFTTIWLATYILNDNAMHFYQKNGFTKTGNIDFIVGKSAYPNYIFSKKLKA